MHGETRLKGSLTVDDKHNEKDLKLFVLVGVCVRELVELNLTCT